jgi:hypothetical protein
MAASGDAPSQTLTRPQALSLEGGVGPWDPAVAIDDAGDALVAWVRADLSVQAVFRGAGDSWGSTETLGRADGGVPPQPQAALDAAGTPTVTWIGGTGRTSLDAVTRTSTGAWSKVSTIAPSGASDPELAVDPQGRAVVVWRDQDTRRIDASIRPGAAAAWQPRAFVSPPDPSLDAVDASVPGVAMDGAGDAVATWQRGTGQVSVETSELGGSWAPSLANTRRPSVRGRARVGARLLCDPGSWDGTVPMELSYRWLRDGRAVSGARGRGYAVRRADRGRLLACRVTATNPAGPASATSRAVRVRR